MRRFQISLLSLLLSVVAFASGRWLGTRNEERRVRAIEQKFQELEGRKDQFARATTAAFYVNSIYQLADTGSEQSQQQRRTLFLLGELLELARAERLKADGTLMIPAGQALNLLGASSDEELIEIVKAASVFEEFKAPFLESDDADYQLLWNFVHRVFELQRTEPNLFES